MAFRSEFTGDFYSILRSTALALRGREATPTRRVQSPVAAPSAKIPAIVPERALSPAIDGVAKARAGQDKRRNQVAADALAASFIKSLRGGEYAYRVMKDAFDVQCERAGLDPISDHRFARLLQAAGGKKYRCHYPKTTMYTMPRRQLQARSAGMPMEARC